MQRLHVEQRMGDLEGFFPVSGKLSAEGWHLGQLVWAKRLLQQNWRGASFLLAVEQTTDKKKKKGLIPSDPHPVSVGAARTLQAGAAPVTRLSLLSPAPKYHCLYRGTLRQVEQGKTDGMRDYDEREGCSPGSGQDFPFELCL